MRAGPSSLQGLKKRGPTTGWNEPMRFLVKKRGELPTLNTNGLDQQTLSNNEPDELRDISHFINSRFRISPPIVAYFF